MLVKVNRWYKTFSGQYIAHAVRFNGNSVDVKLFNANTFQPVSKYYFAYSLTGAFNSWGAHPADLSEELYPCS